MFPEALAGALIGAGVNAGEFYSPGVRKDRQER